jgi:hypothetical protein
VATNSFRCSERIVYTVQSVHVCTVHQGTAITMFFEKMKWVYMNICIKTNLSHFYKIHVWGFQNFEPILAHLALKFQKVLHNSITGGKSVWQKFLANNFFHMCIFFKLF